MEYLPLANRLGPDSPISAAGKHVVIIGGGDTGADCLGTSLRQGALSVTQLEIMPKPPKTRAANQPWPTYPMIYRVASAHEEGGERVYAVSTEEFVGDADGAVRALRADRGGLRGRPVHRRSRAPAGRSRATWCCWRWASPAPRSPGCSPTSAWSSTRAATWPATPAYQTSVPGVFVAGDMGRGQSLIVWAIAEGRSAAASVDQYLRALDRPQLPVAIPPTARPLV